MRNSLRRVATVLAACLLAALLVGCVCTCAQKARMARTAFEEGDLWGYRDSQGRVAVNPRFHLAGEFTPQGIAAVVDDTGWAYIDGRGKVLLRPLIFDNGPDYFSQDLARYVSAGRVGFFDTQGRVIVRARYDFALPFSEGLAAVCLGCREVAEGEHQRVEGGRWGYIDRRGQVVIPLEYDEAGPFEGGKARVKVNGAWREIGKTGER